MSLSDADLAKARNAITEANDLTGCRFDFSSELALHIHKLRTIYSTWAVVESAHDVIITPDSVISASRQ